MEQFVVDNAPATSTATESYETIPYQHSPEQDVQDDTTTTLDLDISQEFIGGPTAGYESNSAATTSDHIAARSSYITSTGMDSDSHPQTTQYNESGLLINDGGRSSTGVLNRAHSTTTPGSTFTDQLAHNQTIASSNEETSLLRHFRYNLAPWIDVGDPESSFGIKVMILARTNRPVFAAILALAAFQKSLVYQQQSSDDLENSLRFRGEAENNLPLTNDIVGRVGKVILFLVDFFSSSPLHWRNLLFQQLSIPGGLTSLAALDEVLSEPLFWLHFRIGMHTP